MTTLQQGEGEAPERIVDELLTSRRFVPYSGGYLSPEALLDALDAEPAEIQRAVEILVAKGFLAPAKVPGTEMVLFEATLRGWTEREHRLRAQGLRHPALSDAGVPQGDIILALLMDGHIINSRLTGGMLGSETSVAIDQMAIYLARPAEEIGLSCEKLAADGTIRAQQMHRRHLGQSDYVQVSAYTITERGKRKYESAVRPMLHLAPNESVLDLVLERSIRIFFSWQSEFKPSRNQIGSVLESVVKAINAKKPVRPLEVIQATSLGDGAVRIDVQLMDLIKRADLVVADVTAVAEDDGRRRVNDNVLIEVGYALASKAPSAVLLLCVKRDDIPRGNVAFDISNVHRIELDPSDRKGGRVQAEVEAILRKRGWLSD